MNATKEDLKFGDKEEKREKKRREVQTHQPSPQPL